MMGPTHALSGVAAYLGAAAVADTFITHAGPGELALGSLLAAGAALAPDLDHHNSTATHTYGFLTGGISRVIRLISGGHRGGTHSILGTAVAVGLAYAASLSVIATGVVCWVLGGVAARAFGLVSIVYPKVSGATRALIVAAATAALMYFAPQAVWVLPLAVGIGWAAHIAGDCITNMGCPLGWPLSQRNLGLPLVDTDGLRERYLVVPGLMVATVVLAAIDTGVWTYVTGFVAGL